MEYISAVWNILLSVFDRARSKDSEKLSILLKENFISRELKELLSLEYEKKVISELTGFRFSDKEFQIIKSIYLQINAEYPLKVVAQIFKKKWVREEENKIEIVVPWQSRLGWIFGFACFVFSFLFLVFSLINSIYYFFGGEIELKSTINNVCSVLAGIMGMVATLTLTPPVGAAKEISEILTREV